MIIMKSIIFVLTISLVSVRARYMTSDIKFADHDFMVKQKVIFEIFMNVWQPEIHNSYFEQSQRLIFCDYENKFKHPDAYDDFINFYNFGYLPKDDIFAPFQTDHNNQMLSLFKVFHSAKDWDTFSNFMIWARFNINPGMFIQALTMAILHREDFSGIVLPPIYEISPQYFFNNYVISSAQRMKMQGTTKMVKCGDSFSYTFPVKYTSYYVQTNQDSKLAYFMEDIGLNSYYYYWNMDYYAFLGGEKYKDLGLFKDRRGEFFIYQIRQLLARYYLERLSNGLGEIPEMNYWEPLATGYYSSLTFYNGVNFPSRSNYYMMHLNNGNQRYLDRLDSYERRISDAIDSGFFLLPNGEQIAINSPNSVEYIGNLIQMNKDSMGNMYYYGMLEMVGRRIIGGSVHGYDAYKQIPSVLELFETSMRDPMFYVFYKRILFFYESFVDRLPEYKKSDLEFVAAAFQSVEIDKLETYFDMFTANIGNAVDVPIEPQDNKRTKMIFKVRLPRLNHKPFNIKMVVNSNAALKATVMIFIGPKYDGYGSVLNIDENRNNFWELDRFTIDLGSGANQVFQRNSEDFSWFVKDRTSYNDLYKNLTAAMEDGEKFPLDMSEAHCGFPARLMLPRGRLGGFAVQMFFLIRPYTAPAAVRFSGFDPTVSCGVGSGTRYIDNSPFGFPFDRHIQSHNFNSSNMYLHDTLIHHNVDNDVMLYY